MMIDKGLDVQECEQDILKIIEEDGQKLSEFTVIIRVKNEERWIGCPSTVLDCLYKSEIIIVDNNSDDKTIEIVKQFIQAPKLDDQSENYTI